MIELVSSEALAYETEQNPLPIRREHGYSVLAKAKTTINVTASVKERASQFLQHGIKPLDAVHLALAEASNLGVINAVRFLKQFTVGFGDYTKEREVLFGSKTLDQIVSEIEQRRKPS